MLKMYHQHDLHGGCPAFWDEWWGKGGLQEGLRFCEVDPLQPLFARYLRAGTTMLEGGCGNGQYVAHYKARGVHVVGLDFTHGVLARLHAYDQKILLCGGDVSALPFRDSSFDLYYSGGVVEHFEGGAGAALREARRVLKSNGVLLISVPYFSPLRHLLLLFRRDWRRVVDSAADPPSENGKRQFFQYAYAPREFKRLLASEGLQVVSRKGYSVLWGLRDVAFVDRAMGSWEKYRSGKCRVSLHEGPTETPVLRANDQSSFRLLLKRLVVSEDSSVPVAGLVVSMLRWVCANMMMYVCKRF